MNGVRIFIAACAGLTAVSLGACGKSTESEPITAPAPPPIPESGNLPIEPPGEITFSTNLLQDFEARDAILVEAAPDGTGVLLTGTVADPGSTRKTDGASLELPQLWGESASEKTLQVSVTAKAAGAGEQVFGVAYSTAEVGNSGWKTFTTGTDYETFTFDYPVRANNVLRPDYLGFIPDWDDDGVGIIVSEVTVELLGE